jgi:non-ribosomal peptide synthase protein (TIGR01720 family)
VDGVSWRILLEDFHTAYSQPKGGERTALPGRTNSYKTWASLLKKSAATASSERGYWLNDSRKSFEPIPIDHARGRNENTVGSVREVATALDEAATAALLHEAPRAYNTEINDLLLTALTLAFAEWTGRDRILIDLEGHGREDLFEDIDTSRTVGWFTAKFPVVLELRKGAGLGEALKSVKEQLRAVPRRGVGYGLLRYLSNDTDLTRELESLPKAEVLFNYLGQTGRALSPGSLWTPILGLNGPEHSARGTRTHLLEINGLAIDGCLRFTWNYSERVHSRTTIETLARRYEETLGRLIDHCRTAAVKEYTPSDFPAARLDQKSLDALIARIKS